MGKPIVRDRVCFMERFIRKRTRFVLIHDGSKSPKYWGLPPEEVSFFTRKYRYKNKKGEFTDTWITFKYDDRDGHDVQYDIWSKDPDLQGREAGLMEKTHYTEEEPIWAEK